MDMNSVGNDFKVCPCNDKTKGEIMNIIKEKEIHDLKTLRDVSGIGSRCGACGEDCESLIKMVWGE